MLDTSSTVQFQELRTLPSSINVQLSSANILRPRTSAIRCLWIIKSRSTHIRIGKIRVQHSRQHLIAMLERLFLRQPCGATPESSLHQHAPEE
jgi:hypothetical protein